MQKLLDDKTKLRVSSVLNKDTKSYGKQFLIDGNEETCWNSDQGDSQWILFNFDNFVQIKQIKIKFQGGFSSSLIRLESISSTDNKLNKICDFYPKDTNSEQIFDINENNEYSNSYKLVFEKNTDFFGRIIIYNLQAYGSINNSIQQNNLNN